MNKKITIYFFISGLIIFFLIFAFHLKKFPHESEPHQKIHSIIKHTLENEIRDYIAKKDLDEDPFLKDLVIRKKNADPLRYIWVRRDSSSESNAVQIGFYYAYYIKEDHVESEQIEVLDFSKTDTDLKLVKTVSPKGIMLIKDISKKYNLSISEKTFIGSSADGNINSYFITWEIATQGHFNISSIAASIVCSFYDEVNDETLLQISSSGEM